VRRVRRRAEAEVQPVLSALLISQLRHNAVAKRRGSLFRDRHHREELDGPTKTRNALVYVLFNERKHHAQNGGAISEAMLSELDDHSSAAWLEGDAWDERARPPPEVIARLRTRYGDIDGLGAPRSDARTWLARAGWRTRGVRDGRASPRDASRPW
jgi:hypothetical protein